MNRKQLAALMSSACVSLVLAACIPSPPDDAELYFGRGSGSIPISEGQTTEVHIRGYPCPGILVSSRRSSSSPVVC